MAKVIEFYVPSSFQRKEKWIPAQDRGKIIEFRLQTTKSGQLPTGPVLAMTALALRFWTF